MFIIACKWNENSRITHLIESIKKFQPDEKIVVVDSDSENKEYFKDIKNECIIEDIKNVNYLEGALWYCYEKYKNEDFFYLLQDSMILKRNIEELKKNEITHLSYFPYHYNPKYGDDMEIYCRDILEERTSYIYKPTTYEIGRAHV